MFIIYTIANSLTEVNIAHKIDDFSGIIGRRYWRADEFGIPLVITLDYETLSNRTVTMRDRDSTKQIRVKV